MDIKLIPADDSDKHYFENLNELVYRDLVERQIGYWDTAGEREKFYRKWQEQSFQKILLSEELIGGVWLQDFETYHQLREIQIHPDYQNQGVGTRIIRMLIKDCSVKKIELRLRVLKASPAVALYKRLGFELVGENEQQYRMVCAA